MILEFFAPLHKNLLQALKTAKIKILPPVTRSPYLPQFLEVPDIIESHLVNSLLFHFYQEQNTLFYRTDILNKTDIN
jgi:hypothetical protein